MASNDDKPSCKYGATCYRKNKQHVQQFRHPKRKQNEDEDNPSPPKKIKHDDPKQTTMKKFLANISEKNDSDNEDVKNATASEEEDEPTLEEKDTEKSESSASEADEELPVSPADIKDNIKQKFLVEMPDDFYEFWDFCKSLKSSKPEDALLKSLGLQLVGPYDILSGKYKRKKNRRGKWPNFLLHWRYYYDPPEFMTVIKGDDEKEFHLGYFRDDPEEMPEFVAANSSGDGCTITPKGDNLFAAVRWFAEEKLKNKQLKTEQKEDIKSFHKKITGWADKVNASVETKSKKMKARDKKVNSRCFHGAGIVVPVDDNEVGYRELPETPADLKKIFKKIVDSKTEEERNTNFEPLEEILTLIQFANDECDYGEGLELGIDMFCYGASVLHSTISHCLPLSYMLLKRTAYKAIIEAHLKHRRKGTDLSEID